MRNKNTPLSTILMNKLRHAALRGNAEETETIPAICSCNADEGKGIVHMDAFAFEYESVKAPISVGVCEECKRVFFMPMNKDCELVLRHMGIIRK
jgi:hypothetical protein